MVLSVRIWSCKGNFQRVVHSGSAFIDRGFPSGNEWFSPSCGKHTTMKIMFTSEKKKSVTSSFPAYIFCCIKSTFFVSSYDVNERRATLQQCHVISLREWRQLEYPTLRIDLCCYSCWNKKQVYHSTWEKTTSKLCTPPTNYGSTKSKAVPVRAT